MGLQVGDTLPNDYKLVELIGRGGHALIYRATRPGFVDKAVKILKTGSPIDVQESFVREAQMLDTFNHPNIVQFNDFLDIGGELVIIMQLATEGSLDNAMSQGSFTVEEVIELVQAIGLALDYCHNLGILHLDLTPTNILKQWGRWLLSDFGIADYIGSPRLTSRHPMGKMIYVAPEILKRSPSSASDQFALATIVFEMLSGQVPCIGGDDQAIMWELRVNPAPIRRLPPNAAVPEEVRDVLARALDKDPGKRFPTMAEFVAAFQGAFSGQPAFQRQKKATGSIAFGVKFLRELGVSGMPRNLCIAPSGLSVFWLSGRLLSGFNTVSEKRLTHGLARGLAGNSPLQEIQFADTNNIWYIDSQLLYDARLDGFINNDDQAVISQTKISPPLAHVNCFAKLPDLVALGSSDSPDIELYSVRSGGLGNQEARAKVGSGFQRVTVMRWRGNDLVFILTSLDKSEVWLWHEAAFRDPQPVLVPLLAKEINMMTPESFHPYEKLAVSPAGRIAVMTREEVIINPVAI